MPFGHRSFAATSPPAGGRGRGVVGLWSRHLVGFGVSPTAQRECQRGHPVPQADSLGRGRAERIRSSNHVDSRAAPRQSLLDDWVSEVGEQAVAGVVESTCGAPMTARSPLRCQGADPRRLGSPLPGQMSWRALTNAVASDLERFAPRTRRRRPRPRDGVEEEPPRSHERESLAPDCARAARPRASTSCTSWWKQHSWLRWAWKGRCQPSDESILWPDPAARHLDRPKTEERGHRRSAWKVSACQVIMSSAGIVAMDGCSAVTASGDPAAGGPHVWLDHIHAACVTRLCAASSGSSEERAGATQLLGECAR